MAPPSGSKIDALERAAISAASTADSAKSIADSTEQLIKETKAAVLESAGNARSSRNWARSSFVAAIAAVLLSVGSLWYAARDNQGDAEWQKEQLELLRSISAQGKAQSQLFRMEMMR